MSGKAGKTDQVTVTMSLEACSMLEEMKAERRHENRSEVVEDAVRVFYRDHFKKPKSS